MDGEIYGRRRQHILSEATRVAKSAIISKLSGAVVSKIDTGVEGYDKILSGSIVALFGGLGSEATGGSFQEGAMRALAVYLFNELGDKKSIENAKLYIQNLRTQISKMNKYTLLELMSSNTWEDQERYVYIINGEKGEWFDLKHALVSSRIPLGQGYLVGLGWEVFQYFGKWSGSAFLNEDLLSNGIGAQTNLFAPFINASFEDIMIGVIHTYGQPLSKEEFRRRYGY